MRKYKVTIVLQKKKKRLYAVFTTDTYQGTLDGT